ncbi:EexN family lipoprotein [Salmonella enterica]|uniref:EexN family lipoprotein n=1 Tax=Salmonella enterica TaxID=28901 RepID=UPI003FA6BC57
MTMRAMVMAGLVLCGCSRIEPVDTVEDLMADPARLSALRVQCRLDRAKTGELLCNRVAEAINRIFRGNGTPYTPFTPNAKPPAGASSNKG